MPNQVLRIGAIVFAAILMGGFVVFKSGACTNQKRAIPASRIYIPGTLPTTSPAERKYFPGSKSGPVVDESVTKEFRIMAGSKSLSPIIDSPTTAPTIAPNIGPDIAPNIWPASQPAD